jgi:hypothetical protein
MVAGANIINRVARLADFKLQELTPMTSKIYFLVSSPNVSPEPVTHHRNKARVPGATTCHRPHEPGSILGKRIATRQEFGSVLI